MDFTLIDNIHNVIVMKLLYILLLALVQLTYGFQPTDGFLEVLYQGEWYTICELNNYNHADIVCKELGYDMGVVTFGRKKKLTSEQQYQLWSRSLYCKGTEDSIYDCVGRYDEFRFSCPYLAKCSCQSMNMYNNSCNIHFRCKIIAMIMYAQIYAYCIDFKCKFI